MAEDFSSVASQMFSRRKKKSEPVQVSMEAEPITVLEFKKQEPISNKNLFQTRTYLKQEPVTISDKQEPQRRNFKLPRELRSKKAGFLMKPSLYNYLMITAKSENKSVNDLIEEIVIAWKEERERDT